MDNPLPVQVEQGVSKVSDDPLAGCLGEMMAVDDGIKQVTTLEMKNMYMRNVDNTALIIQTILHQVHKCVCTSCIMLG